MTGPTQEEENAATKSASPDDGEERRRSYSENSFAAYLAKCFVAQKHFMLGVPQEASELDSISDVTLHYAELAMSLVCIIDRQFNPDKHFPWDQERYVAIAKTCLKYTGTMNGAKMPVVLNLYEISDHPPSEADIIRLKALQKTFPGFSKVKIVTFYLDVTNKTTWTGSPLGGILRGRTWLDKLLKEPRKADDDIPVPEAKLPTKVLIPYATIGVLLSLVGVFAVEQLAKDPGKTVGLLSLDAPSLFAMGGMNGGAVITLGEWHRLLSGALLHMDALHLGLNCLALGLAGYVLESLLGRRSWFLIIFFVGALGGSLMGLALNPSNIVSVGASGAVMGLLSAGLVASLRFPPGSTRLHVQYQLMQFLVPSLIPLATHRQGGKVDFAAHFGGAIAGAIAAFFLMKLWPKDQEQPRAQAATRGMAVASVLGFAISLYLVQGKFDEYAAESRFSAANLIVEDSKIPKDTATAKREVENWGKGYPRDPRVHAFRALRYVDEGRVAEAEAELRAGLGEREILDRAFGNKKLENGMRTFLCELLVQQGKREDARKEAQDLCKSASGPPKELVALSLCD